MKEQTDKGWEERFEEIFPYFPHRTTNVFKEVSKTEIRLFISQELAKQKERLMSVVPEAHKEDHAEECLAICWDEKRSGIKEEYCDCLDKSVAQGFNVCREEIIKSLKDL